MLVGAALCCATAYVVVSLFKLGELATSDGGVTNLMADLADPTITLPIAYALLLIFISLVCLRAGARGAWIGGLLGGVIPFTIAAVSMARLVVVHSWSILDDGVAWWGGWFVPVLYSAIPSVAIGAAVGFAHSLLTEPDDVPPNT